MEILIKLDKAQKKKKGQPYIFHLLRVSEKG